MNKEEYMLNVPMNLQWALYIAVGAIVGIPIVFHLFRIVVDFWEKF